MSASLLIMFLLVPARGLHEGYRFGPSQKCSSSPETRREVVRWLTGSPPFLLLGARPRVARGVEFAAPTSPPDITQVVDLQFTIQVSPEESQRVPLVLGLYGKERPGPVRIFTSLAGGTLEAPCRDDDSDGEALARSVLTKRGVLRACLSDPGPMSYEDSTIWRIVKDKRIDCGQVKGKFAFRQAPVWDITGGSPPRLHDRPGLVSVPKGGGGFDFTVTLAPLPELDGTNTVIGEVISGAEGLLILGSIPVVSYAGQGEGASAPRSKQCFYGSADTYCSQGKPLKKVILSRVGLR